MCLKSVFSFCLVTPLLFISCHKPDTLFINLSADKTNIHFENKLVNKPLFNILYYLYYYNGGGVATGDINNDGLTDIYFAANSKGNNKLYLNKGDFKFEDITQKAAVPGSADWCTGVTMADVNGDGFLDIYVSAVSSTYGLTGHNELFINNGISSSPKGEGRGEVTFTESSAKYGLDFSGYTTQSAFFDYDHDGDLDCYILNQSQHPHANIVDTTNRRKIDSLAGDRLYRNDLNTSAKKFTDVSAEAGIYQSNLGYGLGLGIADINNDGWEDIYIGNDFHENDYYYINNGNGSFIESGAEHFNHYSRFSMGNDIADYNNDGQLDLVTVDMLPPDEKILKTYGSDENPDIYKVKLQLRGYQNQYSKNCLQRNNGNGSSFSETGLISGMSASDWSWAPLFADFDNDGNKDLFISSGIVKRPVDLDYVRFVSDMQMKKGMDQTDKYDNEAIEAMPDGSSHPYLYKGDGKLNFKDVSDNWGTGKMKGYFNGASYADLDNDGNLDLVINSLNAQAVILKNNSPKKNYLSVSLKGDTGFNTFGIGCKAYIFQRDKIQYQQLMLTRGFMSASDTRLHFGLDSTSTVDSVLVVWPDQKFQVIKKVAANRQLVVSQKDAIPGFKYESYFAPAPEILQNISSEINSTWKHNENDFVDFNVQYLIPHEESTRGPKLAVGDVNNDGLDDFFVCGAKLQPGCLMVQTKEGKFIRTDEELFVKSDSCEDVDALFFDANKDGLADLYVVSGGNEYPDGNKNLRDRLYINNGKGHFALAENSVPNLLFNKSSVSVADVDKDGDNDLFVGGLANARSYGYPQSSYLLLNDGNANFKLADASIINLNEIGIVTTSTFTDFNNDGWMDLAITGEWMPLKIYINNKGTFKETDIAASTGLWQSLFATDLNGDGFTDLLAGNWGQNCKLVAGKNGPVKLYIKDFDKNGSVEQVMAYTVDGKTYPFLAKDELERALPVLKKAYLTYSEVAGKTVDYMFYDLFKDYKELQAETLNSSYFIND
ncbi:MAG TPA: VCBS repeat-containing protein, partial [Chitinophagaceae bacterium]|nr:VCBS repeat-containing protein [Chitinophagaceae bacterium]